MTPIIPLLLAALVFQFINNDDLRAETVILKPLPRLPDYDASRPTLGGVKRLFEGEILGPESIAMDHSTGYVYTGLMDGRIIRFKASSVLRSHPAPTFETYARLRNDSRCIDWVPKLHGDYDAYPKDMEPVCGRVLGMRLKHNRLFALDAYSGVYEVSLTEKGRVRRLAEGSNNVVGDARPVHLANDLDVDAEGKYLYFSDSSDRWGRNLIIYESLATRAECGRVLRLDLTTGETVTIAERLPLTNGVQLSHDGKALYFVAGGISVMRLELGQGGALPPSPPRRVYDNLPCVGDNIRPHPTRGTSSLLLTCGIKRAQPFSLLDFLAPYPRIRDVLYAFVPQWFILRLIPSMGLVVELEETESGRGERSTGALAVRGIWQNREQIKYSSEIEFIDTNVALIGTWHEAYLALVDDVGKGGLEGLL